MPEVQQLSALDDIVRTIASSSKQEFADCRREGIRDVKWNHGSVRTDSTVSRSKANVDI